MLLTARARRPVRLRVVAPRGGARRGVGLRTTRTLVAGRDVANLLPRTSGSAAGVGSRHRCCAFVGLSLHDSDMRPAVRIANSAFVQVDRCGGGSSVGQSRGLIIPRSQVRVLPAPPAAQGLTYSPRPARSVHPYPSAGREG